MNGSEKLVLSGAVVNNVFFDQAFALTEKENPRLAIDLSACTTPESYEKNRDMYVNFLASKHGIEPVFLQDENGVMESSNALSQILQNADVLYVGGGSTRRLLKEWEGYPAETITDKVNEGSLVAAGASAGALAWFKIGHSDSRQYEVYPGHSWQYTLLPGLATVNAWATVHHNDHDSMGRLRSKMFSQRLKSKSEWQQAVGIDSRAAVVCTEGTFRVLALRNKQRYYETHPSVMLYRQGEQPESFYDDDEIPLS